MIKDNRTQFFLASYLHELGLATWDGQSIYVYPGEIRPEGLARDTMIIYVTEVGISKIEITDGNGNYYPLK